MITMHSKSIAFFLLALSLCLAVKNGPSTTFSQSDRDSLKSFLNSKADHASLSTTYFVVSSLKNLKADVADKSKVCDFANGIKETDIQSIFYASSITSALGCEKAVSSEAKSAITSALEGNRVRDIFYAASAAANLKASISEDVFTKAASKLISLQEDDGTFRGSDKEDSGTILNAGLALQALAVIAKQVKVSDSLKQKLQSALASAQDIAKTEGESTFEYEDEGSKYSNLRTTATLLKGFADLAVASDKKIGFNAEDASYFSEFLLQNKKASSADEAFYFLQGIAALTGGKFPTALVVSLVKDVISVTSKGNDAFLRVAVTDILGKFAAPAKVYLSAAPSSEPTKNVLSNQELFAVDKDKENTQYQINFLLHKPEIGRYILTIRALPEGSFAPVDGAKRVLKLVGSATVAESRLVVTESSDPASISEGTSYTVAHPATLKDTIKVDSFKHLFFEFKLASSTGKAIEVQQAFVSLVHPASGNEVIVVAEKKKGKREYRAHINIEEKAQSFYGVNGTYQFRLIVGDSFLDNSFSWTVANIDVSYVTDLKVNPAPRIFEPQEPIVWTFRAPEKRPPKTVSLAFTAAVIAVPFLVLFVGLTAVGANLGNFPSGGGFLYAVGFQGTLGAILALYGLYWFRLNMVQTLTYLGFLAVPGLFFAIKALSQVPSKTKAD